MKLWTIQRLPAWQQLQQTGRLQGDLNRICDPDFLPAYLWMMEQMKLRLPSYQGGCPIWAWSQPKPDLRQSGHFPRGTAGVRLELRIEPERVLLSDIGTWNHVLNHSPVTFFESEPWDLPESELQESWNRIFDLTSARDENWAGKPDYIQAVFEELLISDVVRETHFIAR